MNEWKSFEILESSNENVLKYVFKKDDAVAEAVLYKYPTYQERTVMCISVMSGCPMGCSFCGTGKFFAKSLSQSEIVEQVTVMLESQGLDPESIKSWQIMTMSMGEPLLNQEAVVKALGEFNTSYPQAKLLVSTAGPDVDFEMFMKFSEICDQTGLQFSAHESKDKNRDKLVPFKNKLTLKGMAQKGEEFFLRTGRHPFFNYCVHEGNNSVEDIQRLSLIFDPKIFRATISVICESDESVSCAVARQRKLCDEYDVLMRMAGYDTRVFDPAGQDDVGGGCGQLWQVQKWAAENPDKVKRSVGALRG